MTLNFSWHNYKAIPGRTKTLPLNQTIILLMMFPLLTPIMNSLTTSNITNKPQLTGPNANEISQNVGFRIEQRPDTMTSFKDTQSIPQTRHNSTIQELPWTLENTAEKTNFIANVPFNTATAGDVSHKILWSGRYPEDFITTGLTEVPFKATSFFHGNGVINFAMRGAPNSKGMVMAVFVPLSRTNFTEANIIPNFSALTVNQHVKLFTNANTTATMNIRYNSPQSFINIYQTTPEELSNTLGHVYLVVVNPLEFQGTVPFSIIVTARFDDTTFKVPRLTGAAVSVKNKGYAVPQGLGDLVDAVADSVLPDNIIGDGLKMVSKLLPLDNPIDPRLNAPVKIIGTQNMNEFKGAEHIASLGYDSSHVETCDAETFSTDTDEMDIDYLKKRFTYLGSCTYSAGSSPGDVLASFPMSPCPDFVSNGETSDVTLIQYISSMFQYYTGGLTYMFEVVGSALGTGQFGVALNYGEYIVPASGSIPIRSSQYFDIIEISQGSNQHVVTCEFAATTPWLYVPSTNQPSAKDTMGMVNIIAVTPPVLPDNAPQSYAINVYIAGADDFALSTYPLSNCLIPVSKRSMPLTKQRIAYVRRESYSSDISIVDVTDQFTPRRSKPIPIPHRRGSAKPQSLDASGYAAQPLATPLDAGTSADDAVLAHTDQLSHRKRAPVAQPHVDTLRNVVKKYQLIHSEYFENATELSRGTMITYQLSRMFQTKDSTTISPTPMPGYFSAIPQLYRLARTGFNLKIVLDVTPDTVGSFYVFYIPPNYAEGTSATTIYDSIAGQINRSGDDDVTQLYGLTNYPTQSYQTRLPLAVVNSVQKTAELTIPYTSRFHSLLLPSGSSEPELIDSEYSNFGQIAIMTTEQVSALGTSTPGETIAIRIYASIDDSGRFGTLFNVPSLYCNSLSDNNGIVSSLWPSSYGTGADNLNTLVRL